jgi:uncharacterized membrane protein YfcA
VDWIVVLAGLVVGILVGITGVGGGSLMTPFLLFHGVPATVAVGSDLAYAAVAKGFGVWLRHRVQAINWRVAGLLMLGSLPASVLVIGWLRWSGSNGEAFEFLITRVLAVCLIATSATLLFADRLRHLRAHAPELQGRLLVTIAFGALLGAMVTLSSVGSGAIGTAVLLLLYPRWPVATVVGTDLAYAVPLTATAALGHLFLGHVDWLLTAGLVLGAVPGMFIGTRLGLNLREGIVRGVLGVLLLGIGIRFLFY